MDKRCQKVVGGLCICRIAACNNGRLFFRRIVGVPVGINAKMHTFTRNFGMELSAVDIAKQALQIASEIDVFTNDQIRVEEA